MSEYRLKENKEYIEGYLDALSDVLGDIGDMGETAELYKLKEKLRKYIETATELGE